MVWNTWGGGVLLFSIYNHLLIFIMSFEDSIRAGFDDLILIDRNSMFTNPHIP